jgi:PilZ domain
MEIEVDLLISTPRYDRVSGNVGIGQISGERRKSERIPLRSRAAVGLEDNQVFRGHTTDISEGGLSVIIPTSMKKGQSCKVLLTVIDKEHAVTITGFGIAANCACTKDGFRVGMTFEGSDDHNKQLIAKLIEDRKPR